MIQSRPIAIVLFEESAYLRTTRKPMYSYEKVSSQEATNLIDHVVAEVNKIDEQMLMGEFILTHPRPPAFWGDKGITGFGGGVIIRHSDKVIGGIGISRLSEEEDEGVAYAAIGKVYG